MKKDLVKILVVFFVATVAVFWALNYLFLSGKTAQKSKASGGGEIIEISYSPDSLTVAAGADVAVMVKMKPSTQISLRGYTAKFKFYKTVLKVKEIDYKIGVPSPDFGDTKNNLTSINETGTINIQGEIQNSTGLIMGATTVDLVRLVFTATSATGTNIIGNNVNFYLVGSDGVILISTMTSVPTLKVNGGTAAATCTSFSDDFSGTSLDTDKWIFNSSSTGSNGIVNGEMKLFLPLGTKGESSAINSKNKVNGDFVAELVLKSMSTTNNKNTGVLALFFQTSTEKSLKFYRQADKSVLIMGVNNGTASSDWNFQEKDIGLTNNTPVKIKLERVGSTVKMFYDLLDGKSYQLARQFDSFYTGEGWITVGIESTAPDFPQMSGTFDNFKLTCAAVSTPTPNPTGGATGNVKLNLKLKFQGITKKPSTEALNFIKGKIEGKMFGTKEGFVSGPEGNFLVKSDENGVWSGTIYINLPQSSLGKKYTLLIKGRRHIQKKICDSIPTEASPGTYRCSDGNITLVAGDNNLDFSKIIMLVGDLDQNSIVDSVDFSMVRNCLGKSDSVCVSSSDLNLDGVVNTQDFSLIIAALGIRTDEL